MGKFRSVGPIIFKVLIYIVLSVAAIICIFPLIHILALSLSSSSAATAGLVKLLPVDFTLASYKYVAGRNEFWRAILISLKRVALGGCINLLLTIMSAYPLSKEPKDFKWRTFYAWGFFITMLFNGGLIPTYMIIKETKLLGSIWALVLPGAVPIFNVVLLLNFFRQVPRDLEEAAFIDGAGYWTILWKIYVPTSTAAIATVVLFSLVNHWNSWFDGLIYMNRPEDYPLQSFLQTVIIQKDLSLLTGADEWKELALVSDRTIKAAQIFLGALPILLVYPLLQKYFTKGIILGSVKG